MSDDCTCPWDVEEMGGGNVRGVLRKQPDCPGHGHLAAVDGTVTIWKRDGIANVYRHPASWPTTRAVHFVWADGMRRAKHLTDAECAAMYWAAHGVDTMGEGDKHWSRHSRRLTLYRFATHDQAV